MKERVKTHTHSHPELALPELSQYIVSFYSRTRSHSHLDGISPEQLEAAQKSRRRVVH